MPRTSLRVKRCWMPALARAAIRAPVSACATGAQPPKCHISHVVLDSSWEQQLALTLENHPRVLAYAKNQAMGFDIPYLDAGVMRRYVPDFLVRLDIGDDEPLRHTG